MELGKRIMGRFEKKKKTNLRFGGFAESPGFVGVFPDPPSPFDPVSLREFLFVLAWGGGKCLDFRSGWLLLNQRKKKNGLWFRCICRIA